jgi:hypothetical protein
MNEREPTEQWKATEQKDDNKMEMATRLQIVHDTPHQVTSTSSSITEKKVRN